MNREAIDEKLICAIIVTYNGVQFISNTVDQLKKSVEHIVIVDNNSTDGTRDILNSINSPGIKVIYNDNNYGISYALNKGVGYAKENGFTWVLTMDQDSIINNSMIDEMITVYNRLSEFDKRKVACLAPKVLFENKLNPQANEKRYCEKTVVITSGNLVKVSAIMDIGGYEEKLFIDSVDFDFCLRLKEKGYKVIECNYALMYHSLGEKVRKDFYGLQVSIHLHSLQRKYYISRNHIFINKKYFISNPIFCIKKNLFFFVFFFQTLFFEKNKGLNIKTIIKGITDGISGVYGERKLKIESND